MKKVLVIVILSMAIIGCGKSDEAHKEERQKKAMGDGNAKYYKPGDKVPGL